ncbi:MAG: hypothetical protein ACLR13_00995 [Acutalibacteraceae bacterium]
MEVSPSAGTSVTQNTSIDLVVSSVPLKKLRILNLICRRM